MRPSCPKCRAPIAWSALVAGRLQRCPACGTTAYLALFPAIRRGFPAGGGEDASALPDESSCFYHPTRRPVVVCGQCGRFVCGLCDIELGEMHLCPNCLESGRSKGSLTQLDRQRLRYDRLTFALAVYPMLLFYFTIITAPVVLVLTVWFWKAPRSLVEPSPVRFVLAALVAVAQLIGWIGLIAYFLEMRGTA